MPHSFDRRSFMYTAVGGAVTGTAAFHASPIKAIEPITRTSGHHFKYSLAAYSYRDLLKGKMPKLKLNDFIEDCAKFGLDGTELTSYYFPSQPTLEFLRDIKAYAFRRGLDVSGTAVGNDFCHPPGKRRDQEIATVKRWIEYADMMDAPVIRIFSGGAKTGQTIDDARKL